MSGSDIGQSLSGKLSNMSFVCTCLVVCMHSPWSTTHRMFWESFVKNMGCIAVPTFFMISGFLLARHCGEDRWWSLAVTKRIRTLLVPYLVLNAIWFFMRETIWLFSKTGADFSLPHMLSGFGVLPWSAGSVVGFWYVKALMLLVVISPAIYTVVRRNLKCAFVLCIALLSAWMVQARFVPDDVESCFLYEYSFRCPLYFACGMILQLYFSRFSLRRWMRILTVSAFSLWYVFSDWMFHPGMDVSLRVALTFLSVCLRAMFVWSILPTSRWPQPIVGNSFVIFSLHGTLLFLIPVAYERYLSSFSVVTDTLGPVGLMAIVVCLAILLAQIGRRWMPSAMRFLFGGR